MIRQTVWPWSPDSNRKVSGEPGAVHYEPVAVNAYLQEADYYIVSYALAHDHIVITHEVPANSKKKVKIPDVCIGLGVKCMNPYEMLRRERARFVLGSS